MRTVSAAGLLRCSHQKVEDFQVYPFIHLYWVKRATTHNTITGSITNTKNTSFPVLFISATVDPVAPIQGYALNTLFHRMNRPANITSF